MVFKKFLFYEGVSAVVRSFCGTVSQGEVLAWVNQKRNLAGRRVRQEVKSADLSE